ncbi:unnamed protein product, partial [marine sediment metagenome]
MNHVNREEQFDADIIECRKNILRARDIIPSADPKNSRKSTAKNNAERLETPIAAGGQKSKDIPKFDLAEKIMAEQRKKVATKRSNPAAKTLAQKRPADSAANKDTNDTAGDTRQPSP